MSQNPFGHPMHPEDVPGVPPRTSGLAVGAMASSLICCLPLVGLIPAVLGISGLVSISRSNGRLTGRGLAVAGIVLGLLGQMFWCGGAIGLAQVIAGLKPYQAAFAGIEANDLAAARRDMAAEPAALTDEQFAAFQAAYREKLGAMRGFREGLREIVSGWLSLGPAMGTVMEQAQARYGQGSVIPLPADFENGPGMVLFVIDRTGRGGTGPSGIARIRNVGVAGEDGAIHWLMDPAGP